MSDTGEAVAAAAKRPQGPTGWRGRFAFMGFGQDPLGFVERLTREHPGAARLNMPGLSLVYLTDPAAIGEVLLDRERLFTKDWTTRTLRAVIGNGLFTSEGTFWRRQRGLVAPALHRKRISSYVNLTARRARAYVDQLRDGDSRDIKPDMTRLTMQIVVEALFGTDIGDAAARVAEALERALAAFEELIYTWRRFVPPDWKQPVRARLRDAGAALGAVVDDIVARRQRERATGREDDDLLSQLLAARDDSGTGMSAAQVRDEVVTMLLAGHETTAMALAFALDLLARHPEVADGIAAQADTVLSGATVGGDDIARLDLATAAFKETLRLRPPIWLFGREATTDTTVAGWQLRKGEQVLICPWVMHRDPRWFDQPTRFLPQRWAAGLEERLPRHVYLPFGGGPRVCAGLHFALMEGTLVLATICRAFRLAPAAGAAGDLALNPAITLRPRDGVGLRLSARSAPGVTSAPRRA